ncbi:hypothetical protein FRC09_007246 [Ceratobasidium sp. 395]|nr:hypothetical protein FRC09_007246 [Ceratobasidium sp. 395]
MCSLHYAFTHRGDIPADICAIGRDSLSKRWGKADQDPFIGATYVNPFYRHHLFNPNEPGLRPLGLYTILKRLFIRLFPHEDLLVGEFMQANATYAAAKGPFSDENMLLEELMEQQRSKAGGVTLLQVWANLAAGPQSGEQQFAKLAHRLISIVPTSAGCERLFSNMGITHTKLRNRLSTDAARKIVQLKMDLRLAQARDGLVSPRAPRRQIRGPNTAAGPAELEVDEEEDDEQEEEADIAAVIADLINDVDADEDIADEAEDTENQGSEGARSQSDERALPRIVFRWTRELTLASLFDYESLSGEKSAWKQARNTWSGGSTNLNAEMAGYGLNDAFEDPCEGVAAS